MESQVEGHQSDWRIMSRITLDIDLFDDAFLESPFRSTFGPGNLFYLGSIFESQELLDQQNDFIDDYKYRELESIPHERKNFLSLNNGCWLETSHVQR